ncbi:MAG: T9SS type A sorting domain-containing protein [Anaerolineales bacterium]|nr:T9SS type A sorting domain-containing protein [Anaerolineales bacterium]
MRVIAGWGTDCYTMSANGYGACGVYEYGNFVDFRVTVTGGSVGIDENAKNEFAVFPNPASNRINATIKESMIGSEYTIVDQLGKICSNGKFEQSTSSIDISNLTEGIYILNSGTSKKMFRVVR